MSEKELLKLMKQGGLKSLGEEGMLMGPE